MAEGSGNTGILGVIVGAVLVIGVAFYFFGGFADGKKSVDVNIKAPTITAPAPNPAPKP